VSADIQTHTLGRHEHANRNRAIATPAKIWRADAVGKERPSHDARRDRPGYLSHEADVLREMRAFNDSLSRSR